jgi:transcriptional regulator with PAS, ATPase and Fis domain
MPQNPADIATELNAFDGAVADNDAERIAYLIVERAGAREALTLAEGAELTVGRAEASLLVDEAGVSRRHARVSRVGGRVLVEDLGSRNGTLVNGAPLRGAALTVGAGDVITIGSVRILVALAAGLRVHEPRTKEADAHDLDDVVVVADPAMQKVFQVLRRLAKTGTTVLVLGETGVGKEVIAEQLHRTSDRAAGPFVALNCAALPPSLLEAELFGYERGAFTGADRRKNGFFEAAEGGTIFLDELGEMPLATQVKLLRVLEERVVTRLGGTKPLPIDVRIVCATHRDLPADIAAGRFREDLYYRINAFTIVVPPLRERPIEIALLADSFARRFAETMGDAPPRIAPEAARALAAHAWPGNVRELRNAIEHAVVLTEDGVIRPEHLPANVVGRGRQGEAARGEGALRSRVADVERVNIEAALAAEGNNQTRAAARLGISRRALIYKLAKYGIKK